MTNTGFDRKHQPENTSEKLIISKLENGIRLQRNDALYLYEKLPLGLLGELALESKKRHSGDKVYFNRNIHIEISNICINKCKFCSYYRSEMSQDAWAMSMPEILDLIKEKYEKGITEVHIVGGLNPIYNLSFYTDLFKQIATKYPSLHIKAFTAVEIEQLAKDAAISTNSCIGLLKQAGLNSVAGGGAEIFNQNIRKRICKGKTSSYDWLRIHHELHKNELPSNCTMLYGHIETYSDRINHLLRLRHLQDQTQGFNCFIPLKYKMANNLLRITRESNLAEDLRNMAVSRLVLDNIPHVKAYWPMLGKDTARLCLHFGADDLDGTINDTTKIYSMAGSSEKKPVFGSDELIDAITSEGFVAVERDSLYHEINPTY